MCGCEKKSIPEDSKGRHETGPSLYRNCMMKDEFKDNAIHDKRGRR